MTSRLNGEEWFLPEEEKREVMAGAELELLLFDSKSKEPLNSMNTCENILSRIRSNKECKNVYKDYYPYQLEIKTKAYDNPTDIVNETIKLYRICSKEFFKNGKIYVIPAPAIVNEGGYRYCGMHMHFSFPNVNSNKYWQLAMGMYPFLLSIADHSKNFETSKMLTSERIKNSPHIGMARLNSEAFYASGTNDSKYRDIIFSPGVSDNHNPSRMKKPNTIEARMMDTPSLLTHYELITNFLMGVASRIREDNPMVNMINEDINRTRGLVDMTRDLLGNQRYGVNKIFRMLNSQVCEETCDYLDMPFIKQTQFEFREEYGLSADVNGFLSMATKGGWL